MTDSQYQLLVILIDSKDMSLNQLKILSNWLDKGANWDMVIGWLKQLPSLPPKPRLRLSKEDYLRTIH